MSGIIRFWKKLWQDLGARRWIFLFLVGMLLVVIAVPVETWSSGGEAGTQSARNEDLDRGTGSVGMSGTANRGPGSDPTGSNDSDSNSGIMISNTYEAELEARLTEILRQIQGAGEVQVMVTISRSSELILQTDDSREESAIRETDSQGGSRDNTQLRQESQTVLVGGSSNSQPYVVGEIMPRVEGVVVACEGGDKASVQAEISAAVQALFYLEPHKIKVCKMASP